MRFIQIIESESDPVEELAKVQGYAEQMAGETNARRATVCGDRDRPGVTLMIVEFDSAESAAENDEKAGTQEAAAENPDGTTFRNLDVHGVVEI